MVPDEDPGEVAGRGIDDLHNLGNRGLLGQRCVALGRACGEFASEFFYDLPGINLWVVGHCLGLSRAITCDDTPLPPFLPAECSVNLPVFGSVSRDGLPGGRRQKGRLVFLTRIHFPCYKHIYDYIIMLLRLFTRENRKDPTLRQIPLPIPLRGGPSICSTY